MYNNNINGIININLLVETYINIFEQEDFINFEDYIKYFKHNNNFLFSQLKFKQNNKKKY